MSATVHKDTLSFVKRISNGLNWVLTMNDLEDWDSEDLEPTKEWLEKVANYQPFQAHKKRVQESLI
jgi:hypothetical protein